METRSKTYAETAYGLVANMQADKKLEQIEPEKFKEQRKLEKDYRTIALNFPTMIMKSGFLQAVGFFMAKDKEHHKKFLEHLKKLLKDDNLHDTLFKSKVNEYQLLTRNGIEASSWLKRYTQALLEG